MRPMTKTMDEYVIVVARFAEAGDEALGWLLPHAAAGRVCVQNKGDPATLPPALAACARQLPNVGLDQYCHLDYIVAHYDRLPEVLLFSQAGLGEHLDVHEPELRHDVVKTVGAMHVHAATLDAAGVADAMLRQAHIFGRTLNAMTYALPGGGGFCARRHADITTHHPDEPTTGLCFGRWFERCMGRPMPAERDFRWFKNAIFGCRRAHVLSRPRSFWAALLRQAAAGQRGEVLHYIERCWYYALNMDDVGLLPHGFLAAAAGARAVFRGLTEHQALLCSGRGRSGGGIEAEGAVWTGHEADPYHEAALHRHVNVFHAARRAARIAQLGAGTGHAAALMLLARPDSRLTVYDDAPEARAVVAKVAASFPGGRCRLVADATVPVDLQGVDLLYVSASHQNKEYAVTGASAAASSTVVVIVDGATSTYEAAASSARCEGLVLLDYRGTLGHSIRGLDAFLTTTPAAS
jgi:hypothetical protein